MNIHADIFDNFYPFIVIIFFIISILSSVMKKKMKDSIQQKTQNNTDEEYEIINEEPESKSQYNYYETTSGSYNVENVLNKLQDKIANIERQKKQQKVSQKKPKDIFEKTIIPEKTSTNLEIKEKNADVKGFNQINNLPFLQKAIVFSEVFGKPKGLE